MSMARSLSSITQHHHHHHLQLPRLSTSSRLLTLRTQSSKPLPPPNPAAADSPSSPDPLLRKLEDAIHRIIVRRSAPDWLPFLPGSSYWVPPPPHGLNHLVHHFAKQNDVSFASSSSSSVLGGPTAISTAASQRGWPSSSYFINGASPHPVEGESIIIINGSQPEDED
ncbi:uncharacterized protein LOC115992805 [Quercus lobata]|uniref:uncharacterized protein LOC115992805 n=1 Tax=Quercus lobata TaxID=97700 RepID=UPI001245ABAE|nr:uncharacterized protein LOC115992805 [Quercus lobata]